MNHAETILLENIDNPASLFIFPTDVAASRWADHLLLLRCNGGIGCGTIPMEKFIAWDTFKQNSIRGAVHDKKSIPSALRKMFAAALIRENARLCAEGGIPVFTSIIRPEWAQHASAFASWLTGILPQLGIWFRQKSNLAEETGDDIDLLNLRLHYAQFLEQHGLFDPAWEQPPFDNRGNECFLFFPESLIDFNEYKDLLETSGHVTIIHVDEAALPSPNVFFYNNSRSEITEAALYILTLHHKQNIPWDSIVLSIPDTENYGPYVLREFANRNIPYINRISKPLASYPAGQFFKALAACASDDFSFGSLRTLLLNRHLPWKDNALIQELIDFGIKNNCICSWTEETEGTVNVWDEAFSQPFSGYNPQTRKFFDDLRRRVNSFRHASTFAEIRKQYFAFRDHFIDMDNVLDETDIVLSRCITELMHLADLEKSYPDVKVPDPYQFFTGYLEETTYLTQSAVSGVTILPYRTAAPSPFDCHIILGASQGNITIDFSPLAFISKNKRKKLGLAEKDVSREFINLHCANSRLPAVFFCSEHEFSGHAIPHNALAANHEHAAFFCTDLYRQERVLLASLNHTDIIPPEILSLGAIHSRQNEGFKQWNRRRRKEPCNDTLLTEDHFLMQLIRKRYCKDEHNENSIFVSSSSLEPYYTCPLNWLFSRILKLENIEIEASLMPGAITGEVYHAVLNLFFNELIKIGEPIKAPDIGGRDNMPLSKLPESYRSLLAENTETVFNAFPRLPMSNRTVMSMMTARLLTAEKNTFKEKLERLLAVFISHFAGCRVCVSEASYILPFDSCFIHGKVDCILEDPQSENIIVIDFKTKYIPKRSDYTGSNGLKVFQLPLYLRLAENSFKKEVHSALYFSIIKALPGVLFGSITNSVNGKCSPYRKNDHILYGSEKYNDIMNEFDDKTLRFAQEITDGSFINQQPDIRQCLKCTHKTVCRTMYAVYRGLSHGV